MPFSVVNGVKEKMRAQLGSLWQGFEMVDLLSFENEMYGRMFYKIFTVKCYSRFVW